MSEAAQQTSQFEFIYPPTVGKVSPEKEPTGRSGHSMVANDSNLFILGGYNPLGRTLSNGRPTVLEELWKFNFATRRWIKIDAFGCPNTCASSCMVLRGSSLYVFGGTSYPFGQVISNTFKVCELGNLDAEGHGAFWYVMETNPNVFNNQDTGDNLPPRAYGQSIIFHGDYVYTFGGAIGFYNEAVADMHRLNMRTLIWEQLSPAGEIPEGRYKQEIVADRDCFYIFGGGRLRQAEPVHTIYSYNYEENFWRRHTTYPDPQQGFPASRCSFGLVQIEQEVYVCGGQHYGPGVPATIILDDIWHFSLESFRWRKLSANMPEPLYFHRVAVSPSQHLYVYGGVQVNGRRTNRIYRYRVPFSIPKLAELCWDQITQSWHHLNQEDPKCLQHIYGVPQAFCERIKFP